MEFLNDICNVKIKLISPNAKLPVRSTEESAGFDLFSTEKVILKSREFKAISTGIILEMPINMEAQVRPRSGLAFRHGVTVLNSPGTIDSDYRGEVKVILINHSDRDFEINIGDRVAQMVFSKVIKVDFVETTELSESQRGEGGFGSTGIN